MLTIARGIHTHEHAYTHVLYIAHKDNRYPTAEQRCVCVCDCDGCAGAGMMMKVTKMTTKMMAVTMTARMKIIQAHTLQTL